MGIVQHKVILVGMVILVLVAGGCRSKQLQHDQDAFRETLLMMETNQVMSNLIRAYNGYPIVQLEYSDITGQVTHDASAQLDVSQTSAAIITNAVKGVFKGGQKNSLTVTADPITDDPGVYLAYLQFLQRPNRLLVTTSCPPPGAAHMVRCFDGMYYWVPTEYRYEFLNLALRASVMRGQTVYPDAYITAKVEAAIPHPDEAQDEILSSNSYTLLVTIDKDVRNEPGNIRVRLDEAYVFLMMEVNEDAGEKTKVIQIAYVFGRGLNEIPLTPADLAKALRGAGTVEIHTANNRPPRPTVLPQSKLENPGLRVSIESQRRIFHDPKTQELHSRGEGGHPQAASRGEGAGVRSV